MGRGRQKAKHTKVARELKYNIPETDYEQLQRELQGNRDSAPVVEAAESEDELSKWAEYIDEDDEYEAGDDYDQRRRA